MQAPYLYVVATRVRIEFVWRQLEFAFFGALTSVGALFIFTERKEEKQMKKAIVILLAFCLCLVLCACSK